MFSEIPFMYGMFILGVKEGEDLKGYIHIRTRVESVTYNNKFNLLVHNVIRKPIVAMY